MTIQRSSPKVLKGHPHPQGAYSNGQGPTRRQSKYPRPILQLPETFQLDGQGEVEVRISAQCIMFRSIAVVRGMIA